MSNRSKAAGMPRKGRTINPRGLPDALARRKVTNASGNSSAALRWHLANSVLKRAPDRDGGNQGKSMSRVPSAWSDHIRKGDRSMISGYCPEYMLAAVSVRAPLNPNRIRPNKATLRTWDGERHKTVTKRIDLSLSVKLDPNRESVWHQSSEPYALTWLGPPDLYDACILIPKDSKAKRYVPSGVLPALVPRMSERSELQRAADAWLHARQLAHVEALIALTERR